MLQENPRRVPAGLPLVIGTVAAAAVLVGLIFAFIATADGINQSPEELARIRNGRTFGAEAAPPASGVQGGHGGSGARLMDSGGVLELDFSSCTPGEHRFHLAAGVATFEFIGRDGDDCILDFGADPSRPGITTIACRVPLARGALRFAIRDGKPDMGGIADRCSEI